ncbi:MAG: hypothetical protein HRU41_42265, partial [Saprospiraceae bacterium]|nr:hypothetical protein [Saprospiraceae bacterium]
VVRPVSPEDYISQAMSKREENYGDSFQAYAYFQQLTKDNGDPFKYMEGYCQTYAPDFLDTMQLQQRLLLFEEADDLKEMDFGKKKSAKKFAKAKKRAEKSGEEFDEEKAREEARAVMVGMMAPADVIEMDPLRNLEGYINPEKLDEYEYAFENNSTYQGREMIVIRFESNGKVRPSEYFPKGRQSGLLFFDKESQALAAVQQDFTMVIPAAIRPILFLAGYGISNPEMKSQVNYQYHKGKWYPLSTRFNMLVDLTKKNLFSKNERSKVDAKILVSFDSWQTEGIAEIPEDKRISRDKKLEEQVYALPGIAWDNVNRIPFDN